VSDLPTGIAVNILSKMDIRQRFSCALVCIEWGKAAAAATNPSSVVYLNDSHDRIRLQGWLQKHGNRLQVLLLQADSADYLPTALPCPKLRDLQLHCNVSYSWQPAVDDRVWEAISAARQLKTVSLSKLRAARSSENVMALLAALPNLQHLGWCSVQCCGERYLPAVPSLQRLTKLTGLDLKDVAAGALEQLSAFTRLRHLSLDGVPHLWGEDGFPGIQQLTSLSRLHLGDDVSSDDVISLVVNRMTAVEQLGLHKASYMHIWELRALTRLTNLYVGNVHLPPPPSPLQLPALLRLELGASFTTDETFMPMSHLADCPRLQELSLTCLVLTPPGCLPTLTMLQHFHYHQRALLDQADVECLVTCCSSLHMLQLDARKDVALSTLARLPFLTQLHLGNFHDCQCSSLAKVKSLRQLRLRCASPFPPWRLLQLAALQQLTSLGFVQDGFGLVGAELEGRMSDRLPGCYRAIVNKVRGRSRGVFECLQARCTPWLMLCRYAVSQAMRVKCLSGHCAQLSSICLKRSLHSMATHAVGLSVRSSV